MNGWQKKRAKAQSERDKMAKLNRRGAQILGLQELLSMASAVYTDPTQAPWDDIDEDGPIVAMNGMTEEEARAHIRRMKSLSKVYSTS